jgi:peptidyl-prolyl cis-trans isomerase D
MAILEKLRVKAGLLIATLIGLSLLAFVLSDLLDSGGSLFTRSKFEIAEVSGKSIPYTEFENQVKEFEQIQKLQSGQASLDEETMDQIRSMTWENMLQDLLLEKQYNKVGIDVPQEELTDLIMGENPHPAIAQLFTNPRTGVFNRAGFNAFMQRIQNEDELSDEKTYYLFLESEIFRQRKNIKYLNLIRKGLYASKLEIARQQKETTQTIDFDYIVQNFSTVSDSSIRVTENDIKKYYQENINRYKQKESRDIRYVYYEVVPSEDDLKAAEKWINDICPEYEKATDVKEFVNMESDVPFDEKNYNEGELSDTLNEIMFKGKIGTMYGPYFENNAFKISRLAAINYLPDSVRARHILMQATQNNVKTIFRTADSLVNLIKGGADFTLLAMRYSVDGSAQTGGDLGWFREGEMVKSFSDSCFLGKKGDIKIVPSQYGLHIVEILDQSKPVKQIQVGTLVKNVTPSEETDHNYYVKANEFAGINNTYEKFNKAIENQKLTDNVKVALNLAPMDKKVNDLENARPLVNWVYKAEDKDVSTVFKFGNKYVVAAVDKVRNEGYVPLEDIRADIENKVKELKKSEIIIANIKSKIENVKTIEELGKNLGLQVQPLSGLHFTSSTLGNSGIEPNVIAAAFVLDKGKISEPIKGENGIYVISVNNITPPASEDNTKINMARNYIERNYGARTNYYAYEALKELAKIRDNRREFY